EYTESTFLFAAACNPDPVLRLCGVNRALEGLAIDVFNAMKDFGNYTGDPVLEFCEDWMLADEVTHVKMGSDWLRRLTENDPERREKALEFQRTVDKLFSLGGFRGETDENPIQLARKFRQMAGFTTEEIDELSEVAAQAQAEAEAAAGVAAAVPRRARAHRACGCPVSHPRPPGARLHGRTRRRGSELRAARRVGSLGRRPRRSTRSVGAPTQAPIPVPPLQRLHRHRRPHL